MTRLDLPALLALLLLAPAVRADDDAKETAQEKAQRARGRKLLAGLTKLDPALLGEYRFSHFAGTAFVGSETWTVTKRTGKGPAAYRVRVRSSMNGMGIQAEERCQALLTPSLALIEERGQRKGTALGNAIESVRSTRREGEQWVFRSDKRVARMKVSGPVHQLGTCWLLLCRKLPLEPPATYRLSCLFPDYDDEAESLVLPVVVKVLPEAPYTFRGKTLRAHRIQLSGVLKQTAVVDLQGKVLAAWTGHEQKPTFGYQLAADDARQQAADAKPKAVAPEAAAVKAVVVTYLHAMSGEVPFARAKYVVDWERAKQSLARKNPKFRDMSGPEVADYLGAKFEKYPMPKQLIKMLISGLQVELKGTRAEVSPGGAGRPYVVEKTKDGWRIIALP